MDRLSLIPEGWFENDGCTFWFDNWFGTITTQCCDVHDEAYSTGTTVLEFFKANYDLVVCGMHLGVPVWSILAGIGVCTIGCIPFFFGNKKPKPTLEVVVVFDQTQGNNSLRNGTGSTETSGPR